LHPSIARKVLQELARPPRQQPPTPEPLTEREVEVLRLVAQGRSNQEIARALNLSVGTVRLHVKHILAKLEFASRAQVAAWAVSSGLVPTTPAG
jgi:NarL family two-component system response regulator LiaR